MLTADNICYQLITITGTGLVSSNFSRQHTILSADNMLAEGTGYTMKMKEILEAADEIDN
jgi:hypothetical protein